MSNSSRALRSKMTGSLPTDYERYSLVCKRFGDITGTLNALDADKVITVCRIKNRVRIRHP